MTLMQNINSNKKFENPKLDSVFARDVLTGLSAEKKFLSPKYFYDEPGSVYFDEICHLDEYYPYRTELKLLPQVAKSLAKQLQGNYSVIEFGAGSLEKIRLLFDNMPGIKHYTPIDISGDYLRKASAKLSEDFPNVDVQALEADFCQPVELNDLKESPMGFFPGSTIGNFSPQDSVDFLKNAKTTLGDDSLFLVGVDTKKSPQVLHAAYNDKQGVTAKFNLNILHRINRELDGNLQVDKFDHYACFDAVEGCIKMFLISLSDQSVQLLGKNIHFKQGEAIHTESSYKYTTKGFSALAKQAGWSVENIWHAENNMFSAYLLAA